MSIEPKVLKWVHFKNHEDNPTEFAHFYQLDTGNVRIAKSALDNGVTVPERWLREALNKFE